MKKKKQNGEKRKKAVVKDFVKRKVKPGKLNPGAVNRTDTSFKSRQLIIKEQHISTSPMVDSDIEKLLEAPLLTLQRHYASRNRKDAYVEIIKVLKKAHSSVDPAKLIYLLQPILLRSITDVECHPQAVALFSQICSKTANSKCLMAIYPDPLIKYFQMACSNVDERCRAQVVDFVRCLPDQLLQFNSLDLLILLSTLIRVKDFDGIDGDVAVAVEVKKKSKSTNNSNSNGNKEEKSSTLNFFHRVINLMMEYRDKENSILQYTWQPTQSVDLSHINRFQYRCDDDSNQNASTVDMIIKNIGKSILMPWLDVAYLSSADIPSFISPLSSSSTTTTTTTTTTMFGIDHIERITLEKCRQMICDLYHLFEYSHSKSKQGVHSNDNTGGDGLWSEFCSKLDPKLAKSISSHHEFFFKNC